MIDDRDRALHQLKQSQISSIIGYLISATHPILPSNNPPHTTPNPHRDQLMATPPPSYEALAEENRRLRAELAALRNGGDGSSNGSSSSSQSHQHESPSAPLPPLPPVERLSAAQVRVWHGGPVDTCSFSIRSQASDFYPCIPPIRSRATRGSCSCRPWASRGRSGSCRPPCLSSGRVRILQIQLIKPYIYCPTILDS